MPEPNMLLPNGKTCSDCHNWKRCNTFIGLKGTETSCDWSPSRFLERPNGEELGLVVPQPDPSQPTEESKTTVECPRCSDKMMISKQHPIMYYCGCSFQCSEGYIQGYWQGFDAGRAHQPDDLDPAEHPCLCPKHFGDCDLCKDGKCLSPDL